MRAQQGTFRLPTLQLHPRVLQHLLLGAGEAQVLGGMKNRLNEALHQTSHKGILKGVRNISDALKQWYQISRVTDKIGNFHPLTQGGEDGLVDQEAEIRKNVPLQEKFQGNLKGRQKYF